MVKRSYQENFYTLYKDYQNHDNRLSKGKKALFSLEGFSNKDLYRSNCLDLGCSNGIITTYLKPYFSKIVGIDYDRVAMKMITDEQKDESGFIHGDAMALPFGDATFDVIICAQVYEHVPDDLQLFSEMYRVLKQDGCVFFSGPNRLFPIEPHHYLPFLQWFPPVVSDFYLRLFRKGNQFYERSRTTWNLRKVFSKYKIIDLTIYITNYYASTSKSTFQKYLFRFMGSLPKWIWRIVIPIVPNFNWLLIKTNLSGTKNNYEIVN